jgi:hypothetical protein
MSYLLNFLGDLILQPLAPLGVWGFVVVSALLGVLLVFVWGLVSNQAGIRLVKRRIYTSLLESILFRHDLRLSLGAQVRMLGGGLRYLSYAVPPLFILALPCVLVLAQLYRFYGIEPVASHQPILVEFKVGEELRGKDIQLVVEGNKAQAVGALRAHANSVYLWKVTPTSDDPVNLVLSVEGAKLFTHSLKTKGSQGPVSGKFLQSGAELLVYPTEELDRRVQSVSVGYGDAHLPLFGLKVHWVLLFFLVSLVAGLFGARLFKVAV